MRNPLKLLAPISLLILAACSAADDHKGAQDGNNGTQKLSEAAEAPQAAAEMDTTVAEPATSANSSVPGLPQIPISLPKMAYVLDYGFRLAPETIAPLQQKHADMCEALGPYQCQVVSLTRSGEEGDVYGELQLAIASDKARGFATLLTTAAESEGAEAFRANITGEDLSKSIIDTEARLRSRIALRDRLMEVLRTRNGKVEELVEAERNVAAVNEEIDQAQSWLAEQRSRVAMSRMTLTYESANPGASFLNPVEQALGSVGSILGVLAAIAILLASVGIPALLGILGVKRLKKKFAPADDLASA